MTALYERSAALIAETINEINIQHGTWLQDPAGIIPDGLVEAAEILANLTYALSVSKAVRA